MSILLHPDSEPDLWFDLLSGLLPDQMIDRWPNVGDPEAVEFVVAWRHDVADLSRYRNLRAILSLGAGVEQYAGPDVPDVPIIRLSDTSMADEMAAYAVHWVTHFHRNFDTYLAQQPDAAWTQAFQTSAADHSVGILGYGAIGKRVGRAFRDLGYPVLAWSRSGGSDEGVTHYAGRDQLRGFFSSTNSIVNVLPSTPSTRGLLNSEMFSLMTRSPTLVNMGRGATVVQDDLLDALDLNQLRVAVLDVTAIEPLESDSPLWSHRKVRITPHVAGDTRPESAAALICANIRRVIAGEEPFPVFDAERGY